MRAPGLAAVLLLVACKGESRRGTSSQDAAPQLGDLAACKQALASGAELADVLERCTPCGVSWKPLIEASAFDPEKPPERLPSARDILVVLDACKATCKGSALETMHAQLEPSEVALKPSVPWRTMGKDCHASLRLDEHTTRFARGTWYALDHIARAVPEARAEFPLPPLTTVSTAFALPRTDAVEPTPPRAHVTVTPQQVFVGVLPWVVVADGGLSLAPGPGLDYPGDEVTLADLPARLGELKGEPVLIAPRGLPVSRLLEIAAAMPGPVRLGATPVTPTRSPWPEPLFGTRVTIATGGDAQPLALPPDAKVADLAAALTELAGKGVTAVRVELNAPLP